MAAEPSPLRHARIYPAKEGGRSEVAVLRGELDLIELDVGMPTDSAVETSDKHYWHRYIDTYDKAFAELGPVENLIEFGVFRGASIRWLRDIFPSARITAFDILPIQPEWPQGAGIAYGLLDQADRAVVRDSLRGVDGDVRLIIEDGSHIPQHQANCLAEGFTRLSAGGLYILEDISTSHPLQPAFAHYSMDGDRKLVNPLNALLAIQHWRDIALEPDATHKAALAAPGFFTVDDIAYLWDHVARIDIYKRTQLPLRCYACGTSDFDYANLKCRCGAGIYDAADSMTALIWKR